MSALSSEARTSWKPTDGDQADEALVVRSFQPQSQEDARRLHAMRPAHSRAARICASSASDFVSEPDFSQPAVHVWVAEAEDRFVGATSVVAEGLCARIGELCVAPGWRHTGLPERLIRESLAHCRRHGFLKVVLDGPICPDRAVRLVNRCGFQHARTRNRDGKPALEFYTNLYSREQVEQEVLA